MALVFGIDIPVLEFLLILNVFMLFYIVISMFELRSLLRLKKDFTGHLETIERILEKPAPTNPYVPHQVPNAPPRSQEVYSRDEENIS